MAEGDGNHVPVAHDAPSSIVDASIELNTVRVLSVEHQLVLVAPMSRPLGKVRPQPELILESN